MRPTRAILLAALAGFLGGVVFIIACSGGAPSTPDAAAATCDCPTPEPPDIRYMTTTGSIASTEGSKTIIASCVVAVPSSPSIIGKVTGGECFTSEYAFLSGSGELAPIGGTGWGCTWQNFNQINIARIDATAICLFPPGTPGRTATNGGR